MASEDRPDMSYHRYRRESGGEMRCPECGCPELWVVKTRPIGEHIRRWRRCRNCKYGPIVTIQAKERRVR